MVDDAKWFATEFGCAAGDVISATLEPLWAEQVNTFVDMLCDFRQHIMIERRPRPFGGGNRIGAVVRCAYIGHARGLTSIGIPFSLAEGAP
jgi:hypothetical protein